MADFRIQRTIADGDTYTLPQNAFVIVGAVDAELTVSIDLTGSGDYYNLDTTVASGETKMTEKLPSGTVIKFDGSDADIVVFA